MKWYKHDTDASSDAKIKKLLLRYGATGYAVYFHCLELIVAAVDENRITFELEHDSEIIADNLKIVGNASESGMEIVEKIMRYIVELKLFENHDGRITCMKVLKRLDQSMTSNAQMRRIIAGAKESNGKIMIESGPHHDSVMIESCKSRGDETRGDEKEKKRAPKTAYAENVHMTEEQHGKLVAKYGRAQTESMIAKLDAYKGSKGKAYKSDYHAILTWVVDSCEAKPVQQTRKVCEVCAGEFVGEGLRCPSCK